MAAALPPWIVIAAFLGPPAAEEAVPPGAATRSYRPVPPPADFSPPILAVESPKHDWGTVIQGERVRHDFVFKNVGGAPATIGQVRLPCTCTTFAKPEGPIPPGETGIVTLEVDTTRRRGRVWQHVQVFSNATPSPIDISIGGEVEVVFSIDPPRLETGPMPPAGPPVTVTASVRRDAGSTAAFAVRSATTESKLVAPVVRELKAGELYEVACTVQAPPEGKKYRSEKVRLVLEVDGRRIERDLGVAIVVPEKIDVEPGRFIRFGRTETRTLEEPGAPPVSKSVDIVSHGGAGHRFEVTGVEPAVRRGRTVGDPATSPAPERPFEARLETVEPGRRYRLTVSLSRLPSGAVRTVRESFAVTTNDPAVPELTVTAWAALP